MQEGDIYIICTDGLYKDLDEEALAPIIESNLENMTELSEALLASSLDAGGTDNTSIIAMKICQKEADV